MPRATTFLLFVLCVIAPLAFAHHGTAGYDMQKVITISGTATRFDWRNPHCVLYVDRPLPNGQVEHWLLEMGAPVHMSRTGWSRFSIKPGDHVAADTHPAKNGARVGTTGMQSSVLKVVVNGKTLPVK